MYRFLLVIRSNNVSILHRFRDIITFTLYVTTYDLEKSFAFNKTVKLQATFALQFTCKQIVVNTCCNRGGTEVKKVSNSKSDHQASRSLKSLLFVPFDWSHTISCWSSIVNMSLSCTVSEILSVISQQEVM